MQDENGEYVWRTIRGARVKIYKGKTLTESFKLRKSIINANKLSKEEYDKMRNNFEKSLTDDEKETINDYGVSGTASFYLNNRNFDNWRVPYRFIDNESEKGYIDKRLNDVEALSTEISDEALKYTDKGEVDYDYIKSNHNRIKLLKEDLKKIDKIFQDKGVSLDKDIIVYRKGFENLEDLQNGVIRKGYTSTSAVSRINKKTPGGLVLGENEFEIIIPKGMKFLPIENIVPDDIKKQHEILLPRNLKFKLVQDKSTQSSYDYQNARFIKAENRYLVRVKETNK